MHDLMAVAPVCPLLHMRNWFTVCIGMSAIHSSWVPCTASCCAHPVRPCTPCVMWS